MADTNNTNTTDTNKINMDTSNNNQNNNVNTNNETQQPQPQQITVKEAVDLYLQKNKVKVLIGTPCYGGMCQTGYLQSIIELVANFTKLNIPFDIMTIGNESLIPRARNGIVAKFMANKDATHLMFIDADITFSWISIVKLLLADKELSGGCYPKKMLNWEKVKHHIKETPEIDNNTLLAKSLDYVFNPVYFRNGDNLVAQVENGLVKVKDIGTGFMLFKKSVIETMFFKYPELQYKNNVAGYYNENTNIEEYFYTLFDTDIDPESKVYLSEDYLFCKRWRECGGELWLDLSTNLNHTGVMDYKGCLSLNINAIDTMNQDAVMMGKQKM